MQRRGRTANWISPTDLRSNPHDKTSRARGGPPVEFIKDNPRVSSLLTTLRDGTPLAPTDLGESSFLEGRGYGSPRVKAGCGATQNECRKRLKRSGAVKQALNWLNMAPGRTLSPIGHYGRLCPEPRPPARTTRLHKLMGRAAWLRNNGRDLALRAYDV